MLAPLYVDAAGALHAVFTRRRDDLRRHPGEISFPGGRRDPGETPTRDRAARGARGDRAAARRASSSLGALEPTPTFVTNYAIYPFVGLIEPGFEWIVGEAEVAEVLELPLATCAPATASAGSCAAGSRSGPTTYEVDGHLIWGATGRIVADLLDRMEHAGL